MFCVCAMQLSPATSPAYLLICFLVLSDPVILDKITKFESCENHHSNILSVLKIHTKLWDLVKRTNFHLFSHDIHNLHVSPRQFLSFIRVKAQIKKINQEKLEINLKIACPC